MKDLKIFDRICRAMADPAFYPHRVSGLERRDTHISVVFLTGDFVYKLKKPVDFGFLDYTGLNNRRKMCEHEVRLNQRLSNGVYLGVVALSREHEEFHFGDGGEIVEYAVKMRQLPDAASLYNLISSEKVTHEELLRLGRRLGEFYAAAERGERIDLYGAHNVIEFNTEENFRQLTPFVGDLIEKERFDFIVESSRGFLKDRSRLFSRRVEDERICDGHGDLRTEHVYFLDQIQIIDCIEFNDRFRYGDTAVDLAFLHMDVEQLSRSDLSLAILNGYIEFSRDYSLYTVLDFYSCYRAVVKIKVSCLGAAALKEGSEKREMQARAVQYLGFAFRYAVQFARPTLYILCGLPGTGKSTYAKRLHFILDIALFRSDVVRAELPEYNPRHGPVPFGTGIYKPEMRAHVYALLLSKAQIELKNGSSAILDATFSIRKWREEAVRLAEDLDANVLFIECVSSRETLLERLGRRREGESGQSDARPDHLEMLAGELESIDELPPEQHLRMETEADVETNLGTILSSAYLKKREQVERKIAQL